MKPERLKNKTALNVLKDVFQYFKVWKIYTVFFSWSSVHGGIDGMTDEERDQIDKDAQLFMRTCSSSIALLKNEGIIIIFSC